MVHNVGAHCHEAQLLTAVHDISRLLWLLSRLRWRLQYLTVSLFSRNEALACLMRHIVINTMLFEHDMRTIRLIVGEVSRLLHLLLSGLLDRTRHIAVTFDVRVGLWPLIEINGNAYISFIQILHVPSVEAVREHNLLAALLHAWISRSLLRLHTLLLIILRFVAGILIIGTAIVYMFMELLGPLFLVAQDLLRRVAIHVALAAHEGRLRLYNLLGLLRCLVLLLLLLVLLLCLEVLQLKLLLEELSYLRILHQLLQFELVLLKIQVQLRRCGR